MEPYSGADHCRPACLSGHLPQGCIFWTVIAKQLLAGKYLFCCYSNEYLLKKTKVMQRCYGHQFVGWQINKWGYSQIYFSHRFFFFLSRQCDESKSNFLFFLFYFLIRSRWTNTLFQLLLLYSKIVYQILCDVGIRNEYFIARKFSFEKI